MGLAPTRNTPTGIGSGQSTTCGRTSGLQTSARQRHLDKETARQRQEANHCQRLLDERAAYECQEAVRRQWLLDKETAHHQRLLDKEAACRLMAKCAALAR